MRDGFVVPPGDLWVFGYGSLMWDPCFAYDRACPALLHGYHRAFCVRSVRFRGTVEQPGLVLGLNRGGACRGMAFHVPAAQAAAVLDALWAREMPPALPDFTYKPRSVRIAVDLPQDWPQEKKAQTVSALAFVVNPQHAQFVGNLPLDDAARMIARGCGLRGPNVDYLRNTLHHLEQLGMRDTRLQKLYRRVLELQ